MSRNTSGSLGGLFFVAFLVIKVGGTALAHWSWWWVFLPFVPVLALLFTKLGWM